MNIDIKLEKLTGHAKSGKVGKINIKEGQVVASGDVLLQIESNKGSIPVKANCCGKIVKIVVEEGQEVTIGNTLVSVEGEGSAAEAEAGKGKFDYFKGMIKPQKLSLQCDLAIIGGGPGGYVAALHAAKKGLKVVLVEKEKVGGTCLNWGCIPTKALVQSSRVYHYLRSAGDFGLKAENVSADITAVIRRKDAIVAELVQGIEYLLDKQGVELVRGGAEVRDRQTVYVKSQRAETTITAGNIIISTGSRTSKLPIKGIESPYVMTSNEALNITTLPQRLVIVGGGVIGMEFAFMFARFGVEVHVVEFLDNILATLDADVCEEIADIAREAGIRIYTGARVESVADTENNSCVVAFSRGGRQSFISADRVLVAVGRQPNCEGIGLEDLGIEFNERKRGIKVDAHMRTNIERIYAIGDVTDKLQLAHVASHQGIVAVDNILGEAREMDYSVIPGAIFTDPEIATVGVNEADAMARSIDIEVGKFPFAANGKALTSGERRGFVKVIKETATGRVIGATIIGPHATDLIAVLALGIQNCLTAHQIVETVFAHPTTAESIHEAALAVEGGALHFAG